MHGFIPVMFMCPMARMAVRFEQDMEVRKAAKQMEVLWRGAKSFGDSADVFTANFPTGCAPTASCMYPWTALKEASILPCFCIVGLRRSEKHIT